MVTFNYHFIHALGAKAGSDAFSDSCQPKRGVTFTKKTYPSNSRIPSIENVYCLTTEADKGTPNDYWLKSTYMDVHDSSFGQFLIPTNLSN